MRTMDSSLTELCRKQIISKETALTHAVDREMLDRYLGGSLNI
jgi:Tfp pilus assembly ATPase PilU